MGRVGVRVCLPEVAAVFKIDGCLVKNHWVRIREEGVERAALTVLAEWDIYNGREIRLTEWVERHTVYYGTAVAHLAYEGRMANVGIR